MIKVESEPSQNQMFYCRNSRELVLRIVAPLGELVEFKLLSLSGSTQCVSWKSMPKRLNSLINLWKVGMSHVHKSVHVCSSFW